MAPRVGRARIVVKEADYYRLPGRAMARSPSIGLFIKDPCMAPTPWKPPLWALALDTLGLLVLGLGLWMQFSPGSATAQALPTTLRVPLLALGGVMVLLGWAGLVMSMLASRRG
jgi:hypothetical protein